MAGIRAKTLHRGSWSLLREAVVMGEFPRGHAALDHRLRGTSIPHRSDAASGTRSLGLRRPPRGRPARASHRRGGELASKALSWLVTDLHPTMENTGVPCRQRRPHSDRTSRRHTADLANDRASLDRQPAWPARRDPGRRPLRQSSSLHVRGRRPPLRHPRPRLGCRFAGRQEHQDRSPHRPRSVQVRLYLRLRG